MCRSSRLTVFALLLALLPSSAWAQLYGFPGDVGVIDDGFGVLPPQPLAVPQGFGGPPPFLPAQVTTPAPCPLVIEIGRGLKHAARTRVTYGRPACS